MTSIPRIRGDEPATRTGRAVFLTSLRRLSRDAGKRDREVQRLLLLAQKEDG